MVFKKVLAEVQLIFRTTEVKGCDIYIYNFPEGTSRVLPSRVNKRRRYDDEEVEESFQISNIKRKICAIIRHKKGIKI